MSCICVLTVAIPAVSAAWPAIAAAAVTAGGALGFSAIASRQASRSGQEVELPVGDAQAVSDEIRPGEDIVLHRGNVQVTFSRNGEGKLTAKVKGHGMEKMELEALGRKLVDGVVQQYAYHQLVTELKARNFNVVSEETTADGAVRMKVRIFQG